jgi:hypothetical protein
MRTRAISRSFYTDADPLTDIQDMLNLSRAPNLTYLETLSLAITPPSREFLELDDLPSFPALPNLRNLHLTLSGSKKFLPRGGLEKLSTTIDFSGLQKLSLNNLVLGSTSLVNLFDVLSPAELQELYITVNSQAVILDSSAHLNRLGSSLKILHVTVAENIPLTVEDLRSLAERLPKLEQVGAANRVYEVWRRYRSSVDLDLDDGDKGDSDNDAGELAEELAERQKQEREDTEGDVRDDRLEEGEHPACSREEGHASAGEDELVVELVRWSKTITPGYFQVWRG